MITSRAALEIILQAKDEASAVLGKAGGGLAALVSPAGLAVAGISAIGGVALAAGKQVWDFSQDTTEAMKRFQAQTGVSAAELDEFREVALGVWSSGWGESIDEAAEAMSLVHRNLGLTGEALESTTRDAMILAEVFGTDIQESTAVANSLMRNFGVTSDEAMDLLTTGLQEGLDVAGDLQDTLREYSSDFRRMGFSAEQALGILNAGLEAGAWNTDVIADGIREFGIRFGAAETAATEAMEAIGVEWEALYEGLEDGSITTADAFAIVTQALAGVESETLRAQAGAALFGSKWEDIGGEVFIAAGMVEEGLQGVTGATDEAGAAMQSGLGPAVERLKRLVMELLDPLGKGLGDALNLVTPLLEGAAQWLGEKVPAAIEDLRAFLQPLIDELLPELQKGWQMVQQAQEDIQEMIQSDLVPALNELYVALGLDDEEVRAVLATMGEWLGFLAQGALNAAILLIKSTVEGFSGALRTLSDAVRTVISVLQAMKGALDALADANIPDWLIPGSPTPFELGLRGIAAAIGDLPDLAAAFDRGPVERFAESLQDVARTVREVPEVLLELPDFQALAALPAMAREGGLTAPGAGGEFGRGGGIGAGGMFNLTLNFHRDSVRSDDDIEEIARRTEQMLVWRGVRDFGA